MEIFGILAICWGIGITIFWIYMALQALQTLQRIADSQEQIERRLQDISSSIDLKK